MVKEKQTQVGRESLRGLTEKLREHPTNTTIIQETLTRLKRLTMSDIPEVIEVIEGASNWKTFEYKRNYGWDNRHFGRHYFYHAGFKTGPLDIHVTSSEASSIYLSPGGHIEDSQYGDTVAVSFYLNIENEKIHQKTLGLSYLLDRPRGFSRMKLIRKIIEPAIEEYKKTHLEITEKEGER
jgi:hypothetical protein